jgi:hypothetical protein
MKLAVLLYPPQPASNEALLAWVDPLAGRVLHTMAVPRSPNLGVFPRHDAALVAYTDYSSAPPARDWLDVYRLSDWRLQAHVPLDCRAHFNVSPQWSTYLSSPDRTLIYVYKARTLGDHRAEDYVVGLKPGSWEFTPWTFKVPECVSGWSAAGSRAHAQMLFTADGLQRGILPADDLDQYVAFWLGPEQGMGPQVALGPRPRWHSDLGHARAILFAPQRPLSVVVCTDGVVHLIDPVTFRLLERQRVQFTHEHAMPIFAAQIDPEGRWLYVGTATSRSRQQGQVERIVVHDLQEGQRDGEWLLSEPFLHMALTEDGAYLCGVSGTSRKLWVLERRTGQVTAEMSFDAVPVYLLPA